MYQCPAAQSFKVLSCAGAGKDDLCDIQAYNAGQAGSRGKSTHQQVMTMLQICHPQTAQEAQAPGRGAAAPQTASNGIKPGDSVEVVTGFGWTPAKVLAINGNSYRVLANGVQVTKDYPAEVRRLGAASAQDHANGQYRLGDRTQANVQGQWLEGKVIATLGREYQVEIPGKGTVWAGPENLRPSTAAQVAPAAPKTGVPPRPGMTSCAGRIEGRYANTAGFGSFTITFRSGKATSTDIGGNPDVFECWVSGDKILLHKPEDPNLDVPIDINNDGTLQTPLGEIRKKGN